MSGVHTATATGPKPKSNGSPTNRPTIQATVATRQNADLCLPSADDNRAFRKMPWKRAENNVTHNKRQEAATGVPGLKPNWCRNAASASSRVVNSALLWCPKWSRRYSLALCTSSTVLIVSRRPSFRRGLPRRNTRCTQWCPTTTCSFLICPTATSQNRGNKITVATNHGSSRPYDKPTSGSDKLVHNHATVAIKKPSGPRLLLACPLRGFPVRVLRKGCSQRGKTDIDSRTP